MTVVSLIPLTADDKEQFIIENQRAFKFGALEEFGQRDDHIDDGGEIISRKTIEECLSAKENEAYWIVADGRKAGGVIVKIDKETNHNHLEILFTFPLEHSKGIGYLAWKEIEARYPETKSGKRAPLILKNETSTSTSTNAAFRQLSSSASIIQTRI